METAREPAAGAASKAASPPARRAVGSGRLRTLRGAALAGTRFPHSRQLRWLAGRFPGSRILAPVGRSRARTTGSFVGLAPLLAACLWGGMYVVSRASFDAIPPITLGLLRVIIGGLTLWLAQGRKPQAQQPETSGAFCCWGARWPQPSSPSSGAPRWRARTMARC